MKVELDVEKRLQALVAKDRIRIKEFFIDFDKLRKGFVGEAAVSYPPETSGLFSYINYNSHLDLVLYSSAPALKR